LGEANEIQIVPVPAPTGMLTTSRFEGRAPIITPVHKPLPQTADIAVLLDGLRRRVVRDPRVLDRHSSVRPFC
jgi:hypothetical protein